MDSLTWDSSFKAKLRPRAAVQVSLKPVCGGRVGGRAMLRGKGFQVTHAVVMKPQQTRRVSLAIGGLGSARCQCPRPIGLPLTLSFSPISKETGLPKNKNWMNHLRVPQRQLERLRLARMESRNRFLRNPRFLPPNTPLGGKSLLFPPKKPARIGKFQDGELEERCVFS